MTTTTKFVLFTLFLILVIVCSLVSLYILHGKPDYHQVPPTGLKYEDFIALYGNIQIEKEAKEKLAEKWFTEHHYEKVLRNYPDSRVAKRAKDSLAQQLYLEQKYQLLIDGYKDTEAAKKAKEELAHLALDSIQNIKNKVKQMDALVPLMKKYTGTKAAELMLQLYQADFKKVYHRNYSPIKDNLIPSH